MAVYTEQIQKLYVAYFNRPADYEGLAFWEQVLTGNGGNVDAVSAFFAQSPEYKDQNAGKSYYQIVNQIYLNLFNREADVPGLEHWSGLLRNGTFTVDKIVKIIADNASNTDAQDKTTYLNKVAAATAFTGELNSASEIIGYTGTAANQAAKNWLSTVGGTPESLSAAIAPAALASTVAAVANTGLATGGSTQNLTTGLDTLNGTSGNDTFVGLVNVTATGDATTLTALDSVVGGAGIDTLQINALTALNAAPSISVSGVEVVNVRAASSVNADISGWTGVEQFNITEATGTVNVGASASTNINASVKASTTTTTTIDNTTTPATTTTTTTGNTTTVTGGKDVVVRVTDVSRTDQDITVTGAKGVVSVESTGKAAVINGGTVTLGDIAVTGGTTVNVTQNATSSTAALTLGTVGTNVQGSVTVNGDASTTAVNVKQTAAVGARNGSAATAGVKEVVSVKFVAMKDGDSLIVGGIKFEATKDLTAAEVAAAFSNMVTGYVPVGAGADTQGSGLASNGVYTGALAGWTTGAANGDTVVFTATSNGDKNLAFTGTLSARPTPTPTTEGVGAVDASAARLGVVAGQVVVNDVAHTIKNISIDSYGDRAAVVATGPATSAITGSTALETLSLSNSSRDITIADTAATLALNLNKIGNAASSAVAARDAAITITAAPTTLNVKSTGANYIDLSAAATENLNVSGTGTLKADVVDLTALKTVVVTESAGLNTGATVLAATSINTTGTTGSVTVAINGGNTTYAGGAGVDSVTVAAATTAITKSINLGAGDDTLNLTALDATKLGATGADIVLEGGEGTDILALSSAAAGTLSSAAAFEAKFNSFEKLSVGQLFSNTTVNMDNMDSINYVISNGNGNADVPTTLPTVAPIGGNTAGRPAITESTVVGFKALAAGEGYSVAGRTVTAKVGGAGLSAEQVAALVIGTADVDNANALATGVVANWTTTLNGALVTFVSTTAAQDINPDLVVNRSAGANVVDMMTTQGQTAVNESNVVQFTGLTAGQSFTVGGRTVTASGTADAAAVAAAFISGTSTGVLSVSGSAPAWTITDNGTGSATDALFTSTTLATDVPALDITGAGASGSTTLTLDKMLNNATVQLNAAGSVEVKLADATGTADIVNVITNSASGDLGTVTANKVETINITANDTDTSASGVSFHKVTVAADAVKTINVTGAGLAEVVLGASTKVVTLIDGSAATGDLTIASSTETDALAVTIRGGEGYDVLTASGNKADVLIGGAGEDTLVAGSGLATLTGGADNDLFKIGTASTNVNSYATITDFAAGDLIQFVGASLPLGTSLSFTSEKVSLGDTAVFQDYANAAINALALGQIGWFQLGGNTYVVADMGTANGTTGFINGQDFIVKLTGTVDLSNASFNSEYGTIGLI